MSSRNKGGSMPISDAALARQAHAQGRAKSLAQILPSLSRIAPGRVLSVAFEQAQDGYVYNFLVLTAQGRFVDVSLDAGSGAALYLRSR
jgi:uncharacterized membrane protein YkoI